MSKALLPFYALYVGDGTSTTFTLDVSKDPYYFPSGVNVTSFSVGYQTTVTSENLSPEFDWKDQPNAILSPTAKAGNGNDYGPVSTSIAGYQITFTLSSTPSNGTLVAIAGYIQY